MRRSPVQIRSAAPSMGNSRTGKTADSGSVDTGSNPVSPAMTAEKIQRFFYWAKRPSFLFT